jgi:Domain of unknown function (DUF222)
VFTTVDQSLREAAEARRLASRQHARELAHLADYARATEGNEFAYLEVSTLLHISDREAQRRLQFALTLTEYLPKTLEALREGEIEEFKAQLVARTVRGLSEEQSARVEAMVLPKAGAQTPGQLRNALAKAVMTVDPRGAEDRRQYQKAQRRVESRPSENGEGVLMIYDSMERIAAYHGVISAYAKHLKSLGGESRTLAQLEADVAGQLLMGAGDDHVTFEMHIVVPPTGPAEVSGVGPITRQAANDLARHVTRFRWIRTDPTTGELVDATYASHRPPDSLAALIRIRDRTCRFPGCTRPALASEIDHTIPWPRGATRYDNNGCLCRRHHRAKTLADWKLIQIRPGYFKWTSPSGVTHTVTPEPITVPDPDPPPF